jgi:hypothetical protein
MTNARLGYIAAEVQGIPPAIADIHAAVVQDAARGSSASPPLGDDDVVDEPPGPPASRLREWLNEFPWLRPNLIPAAST